MANDIVLSAASRSNLLSLQSTQKAIDITQLRLATGKKVNSALDNPQSFFQSQSLSNRASDLTRLLDGIGQSIRTIEGADKGITALSNLVTQASSVADEAMSEMLAASGIASVTSTKDLRGVADLVGASSGAIVANQTFTVKVADADIAGGSATSAAIAVATNDNIHSIAAKINADAAVRNYVSASVDGQGRLKITSKEDGAAIRIQAGTLTAQGMAYLGLDSTVKTENAGVPPAPANFRQGGTVIAGRTLESKASTAATVNGAFESSATLNGAGFLGTGTSNVTISLDIDGNAVNLGSFLGTTTIQDLVDAVNNSGNSDVSANFNTQTGKIELQFGNSVGNVGLSFTGVAASTSAFAFGTGATDGNAGAIAVNAVYSENFRLTGSSANLDQYTKDFNKLRSQIDGIVSDANYRGVNLLMGDSLTTFFNEDRSNTLTTDGADFSAEGLGLAEADFLDAASIEKSINEARNALENIRAFGTSIANDLAIMQARQTFTTETINTLKAGAADLVNADLNEEGANLLALQTAQQLGVTSLSLASQSQQSVLRLF